MFERSISRYLEIKLTLPAASHHQYLDLSSKSAQHWSEAEKKILYLLPHTDVPLLDQDTSVVNGLGKSKLENL